MENNNIELPVNSDSELIQEETSRFSGASWYDEMTEKVVTLAGLGGIGSYVAFLLSRLHIASLYLYDGDTVDNSNMSGQLYCMNDIGCKKATSIAHMIASYSNFYNYASSPRNFESSDGKGIMICGFDNMEARKTFFTSWREYISTVDEAVKKNCLFIDGRLAAEEFQIYCIQGEDEDSIHKYATECLFDDSEADATVCSYKQTSYCANMIASFMVNLFVNFVANQCNPLVPRALPFYTYYSGELYYLKATL